jgi:hypothetical protein
MLFGSYMAKRQQRKREQAEQNRLAMDRRMEVLDMTWGTAKRDQFIPQSYPRRDVAGSTKVAPEKESG